MWASQNVLHCYTFKSESNFAVLFCCSKEQPLTFECRDWRILSLLSSIGFLVFTVGFICTSFMPTFLCCLKKFEREIKWRRLCFNKCGKNICNLQSKQRRSRRISALVLQPASVGSASVQLWMSCRKGSWSDSLNKFWIVLYTFSSSCFTE